jgi:hypothetical protein
MSTIAPQPLDEFIAWAARAHAENPGARAFCETRVARGLASLVPAVEVQEPPPRVHRCHLARDWCALRGLAPATAQRALVCEGVRHGLSRWFASLAQAGVRVGLPNDVYPVYWTLARAAGVATVGFDTFPAPDLEQVFARCGGEGARQLLLPFPWKLQGRAWTEAEVELARGWLAADGARRLALDGVYSFGEPLGPPLQRLLETGQVLYLDSLSKSALHAQVFGVTLVPEADLGALGAGFRAASPSPEKLFLAAALLGHHAQSSRAVVERLDALRASGRAELLGLGVPVQEATRGYLLPVEASAAALLERHRVVAVPAAVFGAARPDWSVASVLPAATT